MLERRVENQIQCLILRQRSSTIVLSALSLYVLCSATPHEHSTRHRVAGTDSCAGTRERKRYRQRQPLTKNDVATPPACFFNQVRMLLWGGNGLSAPAAARASYRAKDQFVFVANVTPPQPGATSARQQYSMADARVFGYGKGPSDTPGAYPASQPETFWAASGAKPPLEL